MYYCTNCGQTIADDSMFCPYCGTRSLDPKMMTENISSDVVVKDKEDVPYKKGNVLIAIIIIICILAFLFYICPKYIGVQILPFDPFSVMKTDDAGIVIEDPYVDPQIDTQVDPQADPVPATLPTPVSVEFESSDEEAIFTEPEFTEFYASSVRTPMTSGVSVIEYGAEMAFDGDWATAWCEGADGPGIGEWIEMRAESPQRVRGILILNGYYKSEDLYLRNNSISLLKVITDVSEDTYPLKQISRRTEAFQEIIFDSPFETKRIRFVIEDVYLGSMNGVKNADDEDTLITEIQVF